MTLMHQIDAKVRLPNGFPTGKNIIIATNLSSQNLNPIPNLAKKIPEPNLINYLRNNRTTEDTETTEF